MHLKSTPIAGESCPDSQALGAGRTDGRSAFPRIIVGITPFNFPLNLVAPSRAALDSRNAISSSQVRARQ